MHACVRVYKVKLLHSGHQWGGKNILFSEVSSLQEWYILGVGKGVLFREVSSVQECPHRERGSTVYTVCV